MDIPPCTVAFFDIGDTLAFVRVSADGGNIDELTVYPGVREVLEELLRERVRLGILSDNGRVPEEKVRAALERSGIHSLFDDALIVFGSKASPRVFRKAAALAAGEGCPEGKLLYVGEDAAERAHARAAGFLVAPHPALALAILRGQGPLRYLRIRAPELRGPGSWLAELLDQPVVPLHLVGGAASGGSATAYVVAATTAAAALDELGLRVDRLGAVDEPQTSELYLLRDDGPPESGALESVGDSASSFAAEPRASRVLASTREGLLVALPAGESVERFHFRNTRHGHISLLAPSVTLLEPVRDVSVFAEGFLADPVTDPLSREERDELDGHVTPEFLGGVVRRYANMGLGPEGSGACSRHTHHPGNAHAVEALVDDLCLIAPGRLQVSRHCFTHDQRVLTNVVATLPASGEDVEGIVVVSAHLDSTAKEESDYCGSIDPAPGADDNASGIAGVLAAAHAFASLESLRTQRREIRFLLFNCEEHGRVGSIKYAEAQAALGAKIVGVFQMDMIGYDRQPPSHFELHAGFPFIDLPNAADVEAGCARLASLVEHLCDVSPSLPPAQVFSAFDDPAGGRSDHTSFQAAGYPACLATQDFFPGHGSDGELNPNYHRSTDTEINARYAADIARVVAAAAWVAATRS